MENKPELKTFEDKLHYAFMVMGDGWERDEIMMNMYNEILNAHKELPTTKQSKETKGGIVIPEIESEKNRILTRAMTYLSEDADEFPLAKEIFDELGTLLDTTTNVPTEEEIAKWMHDQYEEIANKKGWDTQKSTKVQFSELPDTNKATMIELASRLKAKWALSRISEEEKKKEGN